MTSRNAAFNGIWGSIHFSHKNNRASIERHGLRATDPTGADPIEGVNLKGVYAYNDAPTAHEEEVETGAASSHQDIWEIQSDWRREWHNDPHLSGSAIYTHDDIPTHELRRVGHTTEDNQVHWHPEEECRGA
jgi:hypothetical protein